MEKITKTVSNNDIYYKDVLWWFKSNNEDSFSIFNLESLYDQNYFSSEHLSPSVCIQMVELSKDIYKKVTGKELTNILECGSGGGWITKRFVEAGIDIKGIEGSNFGYNKCLDNQLICVEKHDLRTPMDLKKRFEMVMSTEVAEHIEAPFVGTYVKNLCDHSDLIWFSYNSSDSHSNHPNCMPEKYWVNVFGFFGYKYFRAPQHYKQKLNHRLDGLFYNPLVHNLDNLSI
jgi:hypothetical protein